MYKKGNNHIRLSNNPFSSFFEEYYNKHKFFHLEKSIKIPSKIANQQSHSQSSPTSSQENPTIPTTTQNPQTSTRISFQDNLYNFEERHARLSEPLEPVQRQAPLSEPKYNLYPTLPQEFSRIRNISQNQNTVEINRQIIHPRRNRNFQTARVHFDIPQPPSPITPDNSTLPETPTLLSQCSTSSIPLDYLGSTPTSEQIRDNPFNPPPPPPNQTSRLPYWTTNSFTQGEPNLINNPIDISTDTTTSSSLPETLSLPSTPSISQISPTPFPLNFPNNLDARYREQSSTNIPLRLDWNKFTAPPPLFGQHPESNRLHNWALHRLQYRQDIHEDIRDHNIQILQQNSLQIKFEITVKLNNIVQHPYPLNPPNITAQSLPPPFITTEVIYKYDRYTKKTIGYITFNNPYSGLSYTCIF